MSSVSEERSFSRRNQSQVEHHSPLSRLLLLLLLLGKTDTFR